MSTRCEEDVSSAGMPVAIKVDNGICTDYYEKVRSLTCFSYKPIRDAILQDEHLRMSIALEILRSVGIPQYQVKFLKTDAIFVQSSQRMAKKQKKRCAQLRSPLFMTSAYQTVRIGMVKVSWTQVEMVKARCSALLFQ